MTVQQTVSDSALRGNSPISSGACPFDHGINAQKTARQAEPLDRPLECDADGVWHVRSFAVARQILRGSSTRQAGFGAEMMDRMGERMRQPILYLEGKEHHEQRKDTARFFTPKWVSDNYRPLMQRLAAEIVGRFRDKRRAELSEIAMEMAVGVAGEVVGLTDSRLSGMDKRLNAFFAGASTTASKSVLLKLLNFIPNQTRLLAFFYLDVAPAIAARRKQPKDDVISHLLACGYRTPEILTECITYGAAGMVTTREFITAATWHMLENPDLRARYLAADEADRYAILEETLRLEPVVGHLYRRATADIRIGEQTIPQGAKINLHIYAINADEDAVGADPLTLCPMRELKDSKASAPMASFGDGHHRCPGSYLAIQETDIFLRELLALPGLAMEHAPELSWNELAASYELRDCQLALR